MLPDSPIQPSTLMLWGAGDPVLKFEMNEDLPRWVKNLTIRPIPDRGRWTQQEQSGVVTSELIGWLRARA